MVYTKYFPSLPINRNEILRYCGAKSDDGQFDELITSCLAEAEGKITNRVCFCEFDICKRDGGLNLGFTHTRSELVLKHLGECGKAVLFAATIGLEPDRLISKYSRLSPSKALVFQAIGAERIEALCDAFENEIKEKYSRLGLNTVSRISPGYGDIPLSMQLDIFPALQCSKHIGLTLNQSLLMSPSKSVTAIIGIGGTDSELPCKNCTSCAKTDCTFRREL